MSRAGCWRRALPLSAVVAAFAGGVGAEMPHAYNLHGMPGLIDMPSADMAPDGEVSLSFASLPQGERYSASFQALPWLATTFRYSGIGEGDLASDRALWDRSLDVAVRLAEEDRYMPAIALGVRDILGTGVLAGEYVVATKHLTPTLAVTGGLGWGRLATGNRIGSIGTRPDDEGSATGGELRLDSLFRGDVGLFGGLRWQSPVAGLSFVGEYSSDDYSAESSFGVDRARSAWNAGVEYRLTDYAQVGLYGLNGEGIAFRLTAFTNPAGPDIVPKRPDGWTPPTAPRNLTAAFEGSGLRPVRFRQNGDFCEVSVENQRFRKSAEALARAEQVMRATYGDGCGRIRVMLSTHGLDASGTDFVARSEDGTPLFTGAGPVDPQWQPNDELGFGSLDWSVGPLVRLSFFDPDQPVYHDLSLAASAEVQLWPGLSLSGQVSQTVFGDYDEMTRGPKGSLPRVRTDAARYNNEDGPRIDYLTVDHYAQHSAELFSHLSFGYLEQMYAGLVSEIYWRPIGSSLAYGAELNYVKARDFDQQFGLRDLPGLEKLHGHASVYWRTGYHDLDVQVDVGRYLAGDDGATLTVSRSFHNGWEIGAFVTKTTASADEFGEGSFDKGIVLRVPLGIGWTGETRAQSVQRISSLTGDGGQRLSIRNRLNDMLKPESSPGIFGSTVYCRPGNACAKQATP